MHAATWREKCEAHASIREDQVLGEKARAKQRDRQTDRGCDGEQAEASGWRDERQSQTENRQAIA
jgi:hypothetical protein